MRVAIVLAGAVLMTAALVPQSAQAADPQRFYANFPLLIDPAPPNDRSPFQFSAHHIRDDSNAVALHMEFFGVPWREFGAGVNRPKLGFDRWTPSAASRSVWVSQSTSI